MARDTCVVRTQALLTSKACLSLPHSPAPVLSVHPLVSPAQRPSNSSPPSLQLGRPGASGIHLCSLPSHIGGASCRILSQWELGPYSQAFPPSCSVMSWSAWQVQLAGGPMAAAGTRRHPQAGGAGTGQRCRPRAESVLSKAQSSPTGLLILLVPFLPQA